ncbi:hypothetical protein [Enterococcus larvae]|uniref:hypothetical protein n=1 Tax=Enterococcus larvae TaxID=2794352 RepID=UPI003F3D6AFF
MKIQLITTREWHESSKEFVISPFNSFEDLEKFDVNVIDLNESSIWDIGNGISDFENFPFAEYLVKIKEDAAFSEKAKLLYLFPQDLLIHDNGSSKHLKNMTRWFDKQLEFIFRKMPPYKYLFSKTEINGKRIPSDFCFETINKENSMMTQGIEASDRDYTTISYDNIVVTSINLDTNNNLIYFLQKIGLYRQMTSEDAPHWMEEIIMFDDDVQNEIIAIAEEKIAEENKKVATANEKLLENKQYKSILYTNGDALVEVVFRIFSEMLNVDLEEFEDQKREDIEFRIDDKVFIGEIKGISDFVKAKHLSQLDTHLYNFLERNPDIYEENVYKILIINHQRKKPLDERISVDKNQINLAVNKYESLILETIELLRIFEKFIEKKITSKQIVDKLTKTGILKG